MLTHAQRAGILKSLLEFDEPFRKKIARGIIRVRERKCLNIAKNADKENRKTSPGAGSSVDKTIDASYIVDGKRKE